MPSKRPPTDEIVAIYISLIAREGITTLAGGAGGISIIDAGLIGFGANSFRSMTLQIYPGDPTRVDTADITDFDNGSGEVSVSGGMKGGVVPAGVPYKILTLRPAIAEVHGVFTVLPSAPEIIEPDTTQDLSLSISTVEGIPVAANLTAGTITITRVRAGVEFVPVAAAACATANGRIFYLYTFPSAGAVWQLGDEYKAVFSGQQVTVGATTYVLSDIRCKGIIIDVVAAVGAIAAVEAKLDLPAVDDPLNLRIAEMVGRKDDTIPAMNLAPGVDSLVRHLKAILERVGATPADPDDSLLTIIGQRDDAATIDTMADLATASLVAEIKRVLLRMAPNAFGATVNGNADVALDDMIAHLAAYFVAAGAAWSVTVNPGGGAKTDLITTLSSIADMLAGATGIVTFPGAVDIGNGVSMAEALRAILTSLVAGDDFDAYTAINNIARASVNACFQGIAVVLGADGANIFNPTINGGARTDLDTALYNFALYFNALGAALAVVSQPGVAARTTLNDILTDLADILAGGAGITNFPAAADIANGVSLAEAIRAILNSMVGSDDFNGYTNINNVARASINAAFQGIASVLGADAANIFNPTIQGVAQTDLDAALAQLAIYFRAAGAALAVTMNPGAGARADLQLILQDLADMLAGGTGIVTFPTPRALPANGVSLAEVERYIAELKPHFSTPTTGTHNTVSADPTEDTAFTTAAAGPGQLHAIFDLAALVAGDDITFRVYQRVDGATYRLLSEQQFVGAPAIKVYTINGLYVDATAHIQIRTLRTSATNRAFPWRYSLLQQPVA